jgi:hypothetical protein
MSDLFGLGQFFGFGSKNIARILPVDCCESKTILRACSLHWSGQGFLERDMLVGWVGRPMLRSRHGRVPRDLTRCDVEGSGGGTTRW